MSDDAHQRMFPALRYRDADAAIDGSGARSGSPRRRSTAARTGPCTTPSWRSAAN